MYRMCAHAPLDSGGRMKIPFDLHCVAGQQGWTALASRHGLQRLIGKDEVITRPNVETVCANKQKKRPEGA